MKKVNYLLWREWVAIVIILGFFLLLLCISFFYPKTNSLFDKSAYGSAIPKQPEESAFGCKSKKNSNLKVLQIPLNSEKKRKRKKAGKTAKTRVKKQLEADKKTT